MGEKDRKLITVGRTVLDVTNPKQVQIAWQDEESDIRIITVSYTHLTLPTKA